MAATARSATRTLERGSPLLVYAGADAELMRPYRERTRLRFNGRTSYIRLALKHNVPIVPVASAGGHSTSRILDDLPWLAEAIGAKSRLGYRSSARWFSRGEPRGRTKDQPPILCAGARAACFA